MTLFFYIFQDVWSALEDPTIFVSTIHRILPDTESHHPHKVGPLYLPFNHLYHGCAGVGSNLEYFLCLSSMADYDIIEMGRF